MIDQHPTRWHGVEYRRNQQIGRREVDLWREHQIARCEQLRVRLEGLEREMRDAATVDNAAGSASGTWADYLTAILNDAPKKADDGTA
jgi:hypothetical protein